MVTLDIDASSKESVAEEKIAKIEQAPQQKKTPVIMQYTVVA